MSDIISDTGQPRIPLSEGDPIKDNMSMLNPIDQAYIKQSGDYTVEMKVRDVFEKFCQENNIDMDGPAEQLVVFGRKQIENADPVRKMQNIAGQGGQGGQMPPAPEQGMPQMPPEQGGLEGLLGINK